MVFNDEPTPSGATESSNTNFSLNNIFINSYRIHLKNCLSGNATGGIVWFSKRLRVASGNRTLPGQMLIKTYDAKWRHRAPMNHDRTKDNDGVIAMTPSSVSRADSRFAPSQRDTALHCKDVTHSLDASLESVLCPQIFIYWATDYYLYQSMTVYLCYHPPLTDCLQ